MTMLKPFALLPPTYITSSCARAATVHVPTATRPMSTRMLFVMESLTFFPREATRTPLGLDSSRYSTSAGQNLLLQNLQHLGDTICWLGGGCYASRSPLQQQSWVCQSSRDWWRRTPASRRRRRRCHAL